MSKIDELKLPYLAMDDADFACDPWPHFAAAREMHPWLASGPFGFVVHQYDAMQDLLLRDRQMDGAYTSVVGLLNAHGTPWGRMQEDSLLASTGEKHRRMRDILAPAFTPRQANRHRDLMRKVIAELLDEWVPKREFDFEEFAALFPISVMCSMIGASPDAVPRVQASLEAFGLSMSMDPAHLPALQDATLTLDGFVQDLVAERRLSRRPGENEDLLEMLVRVQESGGMSERELYDILVFLFVAGYDTSKNALTIMLDILIDRPEIYQSCADSLEYSHKVMEETFRYMTTGTIPRLVTEEITYRDVVIPAGTMLFFPVSISGRDPTAIAEAETFDPDRDRTKRHLAFGRGVHICLGQYIARAQIEEGIHQIAQRIRNPRRAGPSGWRPFFGVWGLKGLPIAFEPAAEPVD